MKNLLVVQLLLLALFSCQEEPPLELSQGEILNELHANSAGQLIFMGDYIPFDRFSEKDFVEELTITETGNFYFRMFLAKTLTAYLHELAPALPVRELCDKGNFQLTFFIDNQEVYKYNLQTGAGSCEYKNSATVYGIPLSDSAEPDHWGRFLWTRFMRKEGGSKALANGPHLLSLQIRPYIETTELKVGEIIAQGEVRLSIIEEEMEEHQLAIQKIQLTEDWTLSDFNYDSSRIKRLNQKIAQNYFKNITSIVVIKNGELLLEEYFNGATRKTLHDTRSVGKTMASTILGLAIKDKHIQHENLELSNFYSLKSYDNFSTQKAKITLKDLLTMSSGIDGSDMSADSPGHEEKMYPTKNWTSFVLNLPMDEDKTSGQNWDYFTGGAVVLGDIINNATPGGMEKYANEQLFQPLGIINYHWQFTPNDVPNTAGGFQMNSLDNARYAQLYVDSGTYKDQQILPADWVEKSLTKHLMIPGKKNEYYGYLFWNKSFAVNGKSIDTFYASGNGGNKVMICQEEGIAIVLTATAYNQPYMHLQADEIIGEYLLPALIQN